MQREEPDKTWCLKKEAVCRSSYQVAGRKATTFFSGRFLVPRTSGASVLSFLGRRSIQYKIHVDLHVAGGCCTCCSDNQWEACGTFPRTGQTFCAICSSHCVMQAFRVVTRIGEGLRRTNFRGQQKLQNLLWLSGQRVINGLPGCYSL